MPNILNSPRGHNAFKKLTLQDGAGNKVEFTNNSTSLTINKPLTLNSNKYISSNSTGFIFQHATAVPSTRSSAKLIQLTDSTGTAFVINETGTTWAYLNTTSIRPS